MEEIRAFARDGLVDLGLQLPLGEETIAARGPLLGHVDGESEGGCLAAEGIEGEEVDRKGREVVGLIIHLIESASPASETTPAQNPQHKCWDAAGRGQHLVVEVAAER